MLNKFFKTIHNKYSRLFEFIFFLRYLFIIFLSAIALFLTIPIFFDYEKKIKVIKLHLLKNYNYRLIDYEKIKYKIFPLPNLEIIEVQINLEKNQNNLIVRKMKIYPNFLSIYNYENFNTNRIVLKDTDFKFQILKFKPLMKNLFYKKRKLIFDNLNLTIMNETSSVFTLNNIKFTNFGYNRNLIKGKIFDKNFKVNIDDDFKSVKFNLINSGIATDITFDENKKKNLKFGIIKSKILNTNFKSNFEYDGKIIKIYNSYFRSKNLSFKNKSDIVLNPFLYINSNFIIEELNTQIFKKVKFIEFLKLKDFIIKINNKTEIKFEPKKFNRKFFDDLNLKIDLVYGRLNYSKKLLINDGIIKCDGSINFLEEYPLLFFDCYVKSENKSKFLNKFSLKTKDNNELFDLKMKGNLSVLNRKVNFKQILVNKNYKATKEDLKYFDQTFENILFDGSFIEIFNSKKIKEFIKEIS